LRTIEVSNGYDAVPANAQVGRIPRAAGPVDDVSISDHHVEHLALGAARCERSIGPPRCEACQ
jgi:hypothetical protein